MKITDVRAIIPRGTNEPRDWRTAMAQIAVVVETDEGVSGLGVGGGGQAGIHIIASVLRQVLVDSDPADIEGLWQRMYRATLPFGRKGVAVMALSGVDLALWDLAGKRVGKPVYELLGGLKNPVMPAYASIGHTITDQANAGFKHVKLHMPRPSAGIEDDVVIVRTARERLGPEIELYTDAFLAWDVEGTLARAARFAEYGVRWIEESISPDDISGYAEMCRRSPIPIAGGEHEYCEHGFRELLDRKALQVLQPDACWVGGMTQLAKVFKLGAERGVWVVPHRGAEVWGLHAIAALSDRPLAESGRPWITWLAGEPGIQNGSISPGSAPGFGVAIRPESILHLDADVQNQMVNARVVQL
ncbi:MAG: mandelate racemase/muconate lactonizing enzyme family protein [Chloroflexota bacterium]